MRTNTKALLLINFFISLNVMAVEVKYEERIANLWINGLDHAIDVDLIQKDDQYYIECNILKERNIDVIGFVKLTNKDNYCLVSGGEVNSVFDEASQSIKIDIPTKYFAQNTGGINNSLTPEKASFGGFINYDFLYTTNSDHDDGFNSLVDLGIFKDYWILKNSLIHRSSSEEDGVVRLSSSLDIDFPEKMTRLTLGDTTTASNPLINSLRFAGLSWGTNYTERPDFIYWNLPVLQGSARIPSTVDLYINGTKIYSERVSPGDYALQTGAQIQQAGNAQIVVEDVLGNRSVQNFPIMVTNRLLRSGLSEYNVALGKLRYNYSTDSGDYRDFFANTYYRRGLSNSTTLGTNLSYSQDIQNVGFTWTQGVSNYLVLDSVILASHDDAHDINYSYGLSASKDFGRVSLGLSTKYNDRNFIFLGDDLESTFTYPKFENLAYVGISNLPYIGNFNINYAEQRHYKNTQNNSADQKLITVGFNRSFRNGFTFGLSYFNNFGDNKDSGGILSLSYNFDDKSVYFSASADKSANLQFVKNDSSQVGVDYNFGADYRDSETVLNANATVKTNIGDLNLYHVQGEHSSDSQVNYKGAMVFLDGKFSLTKRVDNAFALVKVGDYKDIDVLRSLTYANKTNSKGYAFVHEIIPYVKYDISFDVDQLPIEDKIPYSSKQITTLNQRGYTIDFPIYHAKQVTIRPLEGQSNQAFLAGSELYINNEEGELYPVGSDGTITLYGLVPKTYKLQIKTADAKTCNAELVVTDAQTSEDIRTIIFECQ